MGEGGQREAPRGKRGKEGESKKGREGVFAFPPKERKAQEEVMGLRLA